MFRFLLNNIYLLFATFILSLFFSETSIAQPALINPIIWNDNLTASATPSGFAILPATTTPGVPAVTVSEWQRNGPLGDGTGGSFNSNYWTTYGTFAVSEANYTYVSFAITNNATTELYVDSFYIYSQVSMTGPEMVQLAYATGSGPNTTFGAPIATAHSASAENWPISGHACIAPGQTDTFKLYGWYATTTAGTLRINNLTAMVAYYATVPSALTAMATNSSPVCVGTLLNFTGAATGGYGTDTYSWSGPLGYASTLEDASLSFVPLGAAGTYTLTVTDSLTCKASATTVVTVNSTPSAIAGIDSVCAGATIYLSDGGGGTWSSSTTTAATVNSTTGAVTGISPGTTTITYTLSGSCTTSIIITVNPAPSSISGTFSICAGLTTALSDGGGGVWTSSNTAVATITPGSGVVTGVSGGTSNITYTISTGGCFVTVPETINALPAAIGGFTAVCLGATTTLTDGGGGTWSSSNTTIATISGTGIVTGIASGTTTITYTSSAGCTTTIIMTVNPLPSSISGVTNVCVGSTTALTDGGGGSWSSSNTAIATVVSGSGVVTGVSAGTVIITYSLSTGCFVTAILTVNPLPLAIAGTAMVCYGATVSLSDGGGGSWSSSNTGVATVGTGTGVISGVSVGTSIITYTLPTGCNTSIIVTTNPLPSPIGGIASVCAGLTTTLSDGGGGTWSSGNTFVATVITGSGIVTGITAGTSVITYTLPATGCFATIIGTVNPLPFIIAGPGNVCVGVTISLLDPGGGSWVSSDMAIATIGTTSGVVTGVAVGTATITYTLSTGCNTTSFITVYGSPTAIIGAGHVCADQSLALADTTAGGVWSSSATSVATVGSSSGLVMGLTSGTSTITYTLGTGCLVTNIVTVNPLPLTIDGSASICAGSTTLLSDAGSGTWSSSNTAVATVGSTGVVTGITSGSAIITYTLPTGCIAADLLTVNGSPAAITGITHICTGQATILGDASSGGTWSSSNTDVFTDISSGEVTGIFPGTSIIMYTLGTGCSANVIVTVNPSPSLIAGVPDVCPGSTASLSDGGGGTWSSSNTTVATVITSAGVVTGIMPGTSSITYTLGTGCSTNATITVNPIPPAITGTAVVCVGSTTLLSDGGGGTWSSSNTAIAIIVTAAAGITAGVSPGTSVITYTLGTGCTTTTTITVDSLPSFITGSSTVCAGSTIGLSDAGGGTWSSSNTAVATIVTATGTLTGISAGGTAIITYELPVTGCTTTAIISVNPLPSAISGATGLCVGSVSSLSDAGRGTWISSNTSVATVVPGSGAVSGVAAGSAIITYTLSTGCEATVTITVNSFPSLIEGTYILCVGTTSVLIDAGGGAWSSGNTLVATINSTTGMVTGVSTGSATITYALGTGCTITAVLTVDPLPSPVTGTFSVCAGSTTALIDGGGGVWSSANTAIATVVSGTGVVTGITADTVSIIYSLPGGCVITKLVTVNPLPSAISGNTNICLGSTVTLSDAGGGTWSSSNTAKAIVVLGTGVVTGVSPGTATISYKISTGCIAATTVTINPLPGAVSGITSVCAGATTVLTDGGVGTWSSSNTAIATIGSSAGIVNGVSAGTATITFTSSFGCIATAVFTVNPLPSAIGGSASACIGSVTDLYDLSGTGTWGSSNTTVATVVPGTGVVTGVSAGTASITFTLGTGCRITTPVTIISLPTAISGTTHTCVGFSTSLSDVGGGAWTSSNESVAAIGSGSGIMTGVSSGTSMITYTVGTGCFVTVIVTANPLPSPVTGGLGICAGTATVLGDLTTGGVWTSSNTSVAMVTTGAGGVSGVTAGTSVISYTLPTGCYASAVLTVNLLPSVVTGLSNVCVGSAITLSNATSGGLWASGNTTVASVNAASGSVTGVAPGTSVITYSLGSGCTANKTVTVMPLPMGITGAASMCLGSTTALASATTGGTWTSGNTAVLSIITPGIGNISGLSVGTAAITYTIGTGCMINTIVTVNPNPLAISGLSVICAGSTTTLSDSGGGTWSSIPFTTATVGATTGVVTGLTAGTATITYRLSTGCDASAIVTIKPSPGSITGVTNICFGTTALLTDTASGGTWSCAPTTVAAISPAGVVTGVSPGTAIISFNNTSGCATTKIVTINPLPINITGLPGVCIGTVTDLSDSSSGGTWNSSNSAIAIVGSVTGEVTGISLGPATITYTLPTGCTTTRSINVLPAPSPVTGAPTVCVGSTATFIDTTHGGVWSSGVPSIATVDSGTGIVMGRSSGTVIISYTILATGCSAVSSILVNALSPIMGNSIVCAGQVTVLTDTTADGAWSSSAPAIATAVTATITTGFISGATAGTATIVYTLPTGCAATKIVTVNLVPPAITGITHICAGLTTTLSNTAAGGIWSSSDSSVASVNIVSGAVTGNGAGAVIITYTVAGCSVTSIFTVDPLPAAIAGTTEICAGSTAILSDSAGGTWGSSSSVVATVGAITGIVYGVSAGTSVITYTLPTGCINTVPMAVDPAPLPVTGVTNVCIGATTGLSDVGGGTWSNSSSAIAFPDPAAGIVSGISEGTSIITYTLPTGCFTTVTVTVNVLPDIISGPGNVCQGSVITLSDAGGGAWSSSSSGIATIAFFTGIVTGVSPGISAITYTLATGCAVSAIITVNPLPAPIIGVYSVCSGMPAVLSDAATGGVWSSGSTAVATIGPVTGTYTGVSGGTATITYTTSCSVTTTVTVIPMPSAILGSTNICLGQAYTLTDAVTGGIWSSLIPSIASINPVTGIITGAATGATTIFYTMGGGCTRSIVVTVLPIPSVYAVSGGGSYCAGGTGVHIGLTGSAAGYNYLLYLGAAATGAFAGTGAALDFGLQTAAGTYTVIAINSTTGCTNIMAGSASVIVTPTVSPSVSISASPAETVCYGTSATFAPVPVNGGLTPSYQWKVNGISVSSGNTYTYVPADSDRVSVTLTSDITCPYPATAAGSVTMTVLSQQMPAVSIIADPGDTICQGLAVGLSALPAYGGTSPAYTWVVNGVHTGSGSVYRYVPLNGDVLYCTMTSNYICRLVNTVTSGSIILAVDTPMLPSVTINANPGTSIDIGESDTLTAIVVNGGPSPLYQWLLNGLPVAGATANSYISTNFNYPHEDSVVCMVTSSGACPMTSYQWVYVSVHPVGVQTVTGAATEISVMPNPNNGDFIIKGSLGNAARTDEEVSLEMTDMIGQVVYKATLTAYNGKLDKQVQLNNTLANGMYIISLKSASKNIVFHIVIER